MANKDLWRKSHPVNEHTWWYEEPKGILIVAEIRSPSGRLIGRTMTEIPWRSLRSALKRKDKP